MTTRIYGRLVIHGALTMGWQGFVGWPDGIRLLQAKIPGGAMHTEVSGIDGVEGTGSELVGEVQAIVDAFGQLPFTGELMIDATGKGPGEKVSVTTDRRAVLIGM